MNNLWPFVVLLSQLCPRVWGHSSTQHVSVQGAMTDAEAKWGTDVTQCLACHNILGTTTKFTSVAVLWNIHFCTSPL